MVEIKNPGFWGLGRDSFESGRTEYWSLSLKTVAQHFGPGSVTYEPIHSGLGSGCALPSGNSWKAYRGLPSSSALLGLGYREKWKTIWEGALCASHHPSRAHV